MFMSRKVEKTPKTKFRKSQPEEAFDKSKKKQEKKSKHVDSGKGFDMWEDDSEYGC